ncbi:acetylxylan esterase [Sphingomonas piscis]|uniref:Acetylxylan esterase n=1 Tax=Sphingomonas piscis TaxID=2714943 RepID=A0A6G7YLC0_9SPHN|nr:acetylxylan esterase [Sphingomonas piscis]QIK77542.1 acetylxylan esterase [Sphingomonas piscis]
MRLLVSTIAALTCLAAPASAQFRPDPVRQARTEKDYQATLQRLGIQVMRVGADGFNKSSPNYVNYDEAKAGNPKLPPLITIARPNARWWRSSRRPELIRLLEDEMYGRVPSNAPSLRWSKVEEGPRQKFGFATLSRKYRGMVPGSALAVDLSLTLPANAKGRVPVILEFGFPEGFRFPGPARPEPANPWQAQILRRGWGYAVLVPNTVQPDDGAGLSEGIIGITAGGRPRALHDWGALRAWAWGASQAYNLFSADPRIDSRRVAIEGLSRYGKAAAVTMAFDQRFSLGFIGSSGAGGAKILRRNFGERVENLTASGEYHWFAPAFLKYGGPLETGDLPFDAHSLLAMAAPRPIFVGAGMIKEDGWVDPRGSFIAAREASAAYRLLGRPGLVGSTPPAINETRAAGTIAFRQHDGGHTNEPNWPAFLDFAARVWGR